MMISIVRKNLACLFRTHKSYVSPHFFSTLGDTFISHKFYDLLFLKHHFPHELASLAASQLSRSKNTENADSILSFLKECGCSTTQLQKIVKPRPQLLYRSLEDIKFKIKILQDLGLSTKDIAKMISSDPMILCYSINNKLIPSLSLLKGFLGSDYDVARLLRKSAWPLTTDLKNTLVPNVEFLKTIGVPMERSIFLFHLNPRFLLMKPQVIRKSAEKVQEMGINASSKMFVHVLRVIGSMSEEAWELKLQCFQDMGFSESEALMMFKKYPSAFHVSANKIKKVIQLLLASGQFNLSSIVKYPASLGCSIENRLQPRLRILENMDLIKWPCLGLICYLPNDKFFEMFVGSYSNEVVEAFETKSCERT